jgi:hypothetical protein
MNARQRRLISRHAGLCAVLLFLFPTAAGAGEGLTDPLEQVSGGSPFAGCNADFPGGQPGFVYIGSEVEPWVGVNPVDPLNVVGTWQQDRWSNGGARGLVAGVSFDGGVTWESVVVPGLTRCSGGSFRRASDPWLSFGPDGTLHHIALVFDVGSSTWNGMAASRSTDGGLTWSPPVLLAQAVNPRFHDKESITADPADPNLVYAVWDRLDYVQDKGPAIFTRSTDGGLSWEPIRAIHDPGWRNQTVGNQLIVLPEGTLIDFFTEIINPTPWTSHVYIASKRSEDKGLTWGPASGSARVHPILPLTSVAPQTGTDVRDGAFIFDVAVDPRNGALYIVWQEGGLGPVPLPVVAFSMSRDGGATWSLPVAVNRTSTDPPSRRSQAFTPSVHVAGDGTVGISHYDFRFDGPEPASLTDHWLIWCHPEAADCTNPERWRNEVRLTEASFDIHEAPYARGLFLGARRSSSPDRPDSGSTRSAPLSAGEGGPRWRRKPSWSIWPTFTPSTISLMTWRGWKGFGAFSSLRPRQIPGCAVGGS